MVLKNLPKLPLGLPHIGLPPIFRKRHPPAGARPGTLVLPEETVPTT